MKLHLILFFFVVAACVACTPVDVSSEAPVVTVVPRLVVEEETDPEPIGGSILTMVQVGPDQFEFYDGVDVLYAVLSEPEITPELREKNFILSDEGVDFFAQTGDFRIRETDDTLIFVRQEGCEGGVARVRSESMMLACAMPHVGAGNSIEWQIEFFTHACLSGAARLEVHDRNIPRVPVLYECKADGTLDSWILDQVLWLFQDRGLVPEGVSVSHYIGRGKVALSNGEEMIVNAHEVCVPGGCIQELDLLASLPRP